MTHATIHPRYSGFVRDESTGETLLHLHDADTGATRLYRHNACEDVDGQELTALDDEEIGDEARELLMPILAHWREFEIGGVQ
ncbi:MAG: hypothetical protein ACPGWS_09140 [Solirubrobacterales bacterium]